MLFILLKWIQILILHASDFDGFDINDVDLAETNIDIVPDSQESNSFLSDIEIDTDLSSIDSDDEGNTPIPGRPQDNHDNHNEIDLDNNVNA